MVYRGKPSAGCENCRKAKKRCTLEIPACARCVKLRKPCVGYRDPNALQIEDESQAVIHKATRRKKTSSVEPTCYLDIEAIAGSMLPDESSSLSGSEGRVDTPLLDEVFDLLPTQTALKGGVVLVSGGTGLLLRDRPDDVATMNFFNSFTSSSVKSHLRGLAAQPRMDPCLEFAIRACGMAALDNVGTVAMGKEYSRSMYARSVSLLHDALRDPVRCKTDETLIAVAMLGYFENLTCEGRESIQFWKAHINGTASLLRIRGKAQLQTPMGRLLFRETRAQILISCLWDDAVPPRVLRDWDEELQSLTLAPHELVFQADKLSSIIYDFCLIRHSVVAKLYNVAEAARNIDDIERRMNEWEEEAVALGDAYLFTEIEVPDSPHVWNGVVHDYTTQLGSAIWNTWRTIKIMVTRSQEFICDELQLSQAEFNNRIRSLRKTRRHLADGICATIPGQLGHAAPAFNSSCVLITAYNSVWPLLFAGTCSLERVGLQTWPSPPDVANPMLTSAVAAQVTWIIGRLDYIADKIGLKWAKGIAAVLRGDLGLANELLPEHVPLARKEAWVAELESSRCGPKWLIEDGRDVVHESPT